MRMPTAFEADLRETLETVARRYSELFESADELSTAGGSLVFTGGEDDPDTLETLRRSALPTPENVTETVRGWHFGRFAAMRSTAARESLDRDHAGASEGILARRQSRCRACAPSTACCKALPAGAQLFALLRNNPRPARPARHDPRALRHGLPRSSHGGRTSPMRCSIRAPRRRRDGRTRKLERSLQRGAELRGRARPRASVRRRAALPDLASGC